MKEGRSSFSHSALLAIEAGASVPNARSKAIGGFVRIYADFAGADNDE